MGHHKEKNEKRLNYCIEGWHTSTPYDIFWSQSTYPNVCAFNRYVAPDQSLYCSLQKIDILFQF